jgi:hypothetical protein
MWARDLASLFRSTREHGRMENGTPFLREDGDDLKPQISG